jgi:hypothetical protein
MSFSNLRALTYNGSSFLLGENSMCKLWGGITASICFLFALGASNLRANISAPVRKPTSLSPAYIPLPPSPPHPLRQVLPPAVPAGVILYKDVRVQIQVSVDDRGRIISARPLASPEKVNQSLLGVALKAATQWQFQPATLHGRSVGGEYTIVFQFHPKQY